MDFGPTRIDVYMRAREVCITYWIRHRQKHEQFHWGNGELNPPAFHVPYGDDVIVLSLFSYSVQTIPQLHVTVEVTPGTSLSGQSNERIPRDGYTTILHIHVYGPTCSSWRQVQTFTENPATILHILHSSCLHLSNKVISDNNPT